VTTIDVEACQLCWSPDGKALYASWFANEEREIRGTHHRIDLAARTVEQLDWPAGVRPIEWSRDGKAVLVSKFFYDRVLLALMSPDGKRVTDLWGADIQDDGWLVEARLSPDGRQVLYTDCPPGKKAHQDRGMTSRLYVFDIAAKKRSEVAGVPPNATVLFCCWSPDGKKIAYVWRERHAELAEKLARGVEPAGAEFWRETRMFLTVANADGSGARTVASAKGAHAIDLPLGGIDWR
jgi:Tol biopolymer transport system component